MDFENSLETIKTLVQYGQLPRFIYRFTSIAEKSDDSKLTDRFKESLIEGKLYFSHPREFNDPFDTNITVKTDNTLEEKMALIDKWDSLGRLNPEQKKHIQQVYSSPDLFTKNVLDSIEKAKETLSICCFSKFNDNILLWSHYADSHKGVCLKFDILKSPDFFMTPFHVKYKRKYPKFNYLRHSDKTAKVLVESKSIDWKYEREIRVLKKGFPQSYYFDKQSLVSIIFGCKCLDSNVQEVIDLTNKHGYAINEFYKAKISTVDYKLLFDKVE